MGGQVQKNRQEDALCLYINTFEYFFLMGCILLEKDLITVLKETFENL